MRNCKRCGNLFEPFHECVRVCPDCQEIIREENKKLIDFQNFWEGFEPENSVPRICAYCNDPYWRNKQATKAIYCIECAEMIKTRKTRERVKRFRSLHKGM